MVDYTEDNAIIRDKMRLGKTLDHITKRDLDLNCLPVNLIYDRKLWL